MKTQFTTDINAIYADDPTYTVKPNCAIDLEYTGYWGDGVTHSMHS